MCRAGMSDKNKLCLIPRLFPLTASRGVPPWGEPSEPGKIAPDRAPVPLRQPAYNNHLGSCSDNAKTRPCFALLITGKILEEI